MFYYSLFIGLGLSLAIVVLIVVLSDRSFLNSLVELFNNRGACTIDTSSKGVAIEFEHELPLNCNSGVAIKESLTEDNELDGFYLRNKFYHNGRFEM